LWGLFTRYPSIICAAFIPAIYDVALIFAGVGGLLFIVMYILTALRLIKLGRVGT
jgi:hypothetical protein